MFFLNFSQILGLLLFFFGLIILHRLSAMERQDYMTRSLPETMHRSGPGSRERETTRLLVRKSLLYSVAALFISLWGMAMFFISAS